MEGGDVFEAAGFPLVGKETLFEEEMPKARFHMRVARIHCEGNELAQRFNDRVEKLFPNHPEYVAWPLLTSLAKLDHNWHFRGW